MRAQQSTTVFRVDGLALSFQTRSLPYLAYVDSDQLLVWWVTYSVTSNNTTMQIFHTIIHYENSSSQSFCHCSSPPSNTSLVPGADSAFQFGNILMILYLVPLSGSVSQSSQLTVWHSRLCSMIHFLYTCFTLPLCFKSHTPSWFTCSLRHFLSRTTGCMVGHR